MRITKAMLETRLRAAEDRYRVLDQKYGLMERFALPDDFTFPPGTWRRYEQWWDKPHGDRREWTLGGRDYSVSFWFRPPTESDRREGMVIAGIESHYHVHEYAEATPCRNSPTGFCRHDGTSLGGCELYQRVDYGNGIVDETSIWRTLVRWYNDRSEDAE